MKLEYVISSIIATEIKQDAEKKVQSSSIHSQVLTNLLKDFYQSTLQQKDYYRIEDKVEVYIRPYENHSEYYGNDEFILLVVSPMIKHKKKMFNITEFVEYMN